MSSSRRRASGCSRQTQPDSSSLCPRSSLSSAQARRGEARAAAGAGQGISRLPVDLPEVNMWPVHLQQVSQLKVDLPPV